MNRRIKKKLKKKASNSMIAFHPFRHEMVPVAKTYRGIKLERKKVHNACVWLRHVTYQNDGYDAQLKHKRRFRREYAKAFDEKLKCNKNYANWGVDTSGTPVCIDYTMEE